MAAGSLKIPQPLSGDEIREGIATRMAAEFKDAVLKSLARSCSFNHTSFPKFSAKWNVEYRLDDYGRITHGAMPGTLGEPLFDQGEQVSGEIPEVPPDQFRRETQQPIPAPQVIQNKPESEIGLTKNRRGKGKQKTT